ncbi:DUF4345 domain-containing protein [Variovorax sp. J22R133]|uniref:DUF4345 domain-containing protein n=1 Tax=Variovorax brevis TaxID=3053503 RepID=UPI0025749EE7|nr:DUF4345 domain-containing protein [Variovorax sp. J22R133]MDM0117329.1 DUF4345 domain-containing protein [Variovorax sp. J22R133]
MKRALQLIVIVLSLLPLTVGMLGLVRGVEFYIPLEVANPNLDSQFRFMSGWDVGLAMIVWWIVPQIGRQTALFRIVCAAVFLGGLGRLAAWHVTGAPALAVALVALIELLIPALIPWQAYVARHEFAPP